MTHTKERGGSSTPVKSEFSLENDFLEVGSSYESGLGLVLAESVIKPMEFLIDWVSFTFDDLEYSFFGRESGNLISISDTRENDRILDELYRILGFRDEFGNICSWRKAKNQEFAVNGYKFAGMVGEFIRLNFCGPDSKRGRATTQLLMSGAACKEFYVDRGGSFLELFRFLLSLNGRFCRVDGDIDWFSSENLDIYYLYNLVDQGKWWGSFRSCRQIKETDYSLGGASSRGMSLTFGKTPGTVIQFYDKNAERCAANEANQGTDIWFRCEIRFSDEKADQFVAAYCQAVEFSSDSEISVGSLMKSSLSGLLNFVNPRDSTLKESYRKSPLDPCWEKFLDGCSRLKFHKTKEERSLFRKWEWFQRSMARLLGSFMMVDPEFGNNLFELCGKGIMILDEKQKEAIRKVFRDRGLNPPTDKEFLEIAKTYSKFDIEEELPF